MGRGSEPPLRRVDPAQVPRKPKVHRKQRRERQCEARQRHRLLAHIQGRHDLSLGAELRLGCRLLLEEAPE